MDFLVSPANFCRGCGVPKGCLSGLERFEGPDPAEFCPRGFAVVNVDARGIYTNV
jgi:predicted acyl esterase